MIVWRYDARPRPAILRLQPWSGLLLGNQRAVELITSDPNVAEIQGFTGGEISLSDYANRRYIPDPTKLTPEQLRFTGILRGDKASIVDTPIVASVAELADAAGKSLVVRGARDLQFSDLQRDGNLVLLGSPRSDPWVGLFSDRMDFRFEFDPKTGKEFLRNVRPRSGEKPTYFETAPGLGTGETYAVIAFLPSPEQDNEALILAGETAEGTEAAGKLVTSPARLKQALQKCGSNPSSFHHFELLLHLDAMAGSPRDAEPIVCHAL
jgi:hypothetical protein